MVASLHIYEADQLREGRQWYVNVDGAAPAHILMSFLSLILDFRENKKQREEQFSNESESDGVLEKRYKRRRCRPASVCRC